MLVAALLFTACSSQDDDAVAQQQQQQSSALRFDLFDAGAAVSRAATGSDGGTMTTTFAEGDAAGLYVVSGGAVKYANIKLTYNSYGFWEAETLISTSVASGAQFYAYYPYTEDATFDASASDPFQAMVDARIPAADQSYTQAYEAADIMTTAATTFDATNNTVRLALKHQKALLYIELPNQSYFFKNADMDPYLLSYAENAEFTVGGETVQPYYDASSASYRYIVTPGEESAMQVTFTYKGTERTADLTNVDLIPAGQYAKYSIDGGVKILSTDWLLEVGDYYCADGTLAKTVSDATSTILGVVFKIGTTDAIQTANGHWSHAVVVALADQAVAKWSTSGSTTTAENNAGWRTWYKRYGLSDQGTTAAASLDEGTMLEEGYETTQIWRSLPNPITIGEYSKDYVSLMQENLENWAYANPLPDGINTGWFIPSMKDWKNCEDADIESKVTAVSGGARFLWNTKSNSYWTSNVRGAGSNWCYLGGQTEVSKRYVGTVYDKNSRGFRFMFAF